MASSRSTRLIGSAQAILANCAALAKRTVKGLGCGERGRSVVGSDQHVDIPTQRIKPLVGLEVALLEMPALDFFDVAWISVGAHWFHEPAKWRRCSSELGARGASGARLVVVLGLRRPVERRRSRARHVKGVDGRAVDCDPASCVVQHAELGRWRAAFCSDDRGSQSTQGGGGVPGCEAAVRSPDV